MSITVFPITPNGAITEAAWTGLNLAAIGKGGRRQTGFDLSDGGALNLSVAAGTATIGGFYIDINSVTTVALTDNDVNRIWLQADGTVYDNLSDTPAAATDILLGRATTSGGSITAIQGSKEVADSGGVELESRRRNYVGIDALAVGQSATSLVTLSLEPGLYWIRACVHAQGAASSSGQTWQLRMVVATASGSSFEFGYLNHGDEGASDDSAWRTNTSLVTFTATQNGIPNPTHIIGKLELADAGELTLDCVTSAQFSINNGWLTAIKIA